VIIKSFKAKLEAMIVDEEYFSSLREIKRTKKGSLDDEFSYQPKSNSKNATT